MQPGYSSVVPYCDTISNKSQFGYQATHSMNSNKGVKFNPINTFRLVLSHTKNTKYVNDVNDSICDI